jgi:hypothetical protein
LKQIVHKLVLKFYLNKGFIPMLNQLLVCLNLSQVGRLLALMVICFAANAGCNLSVPSTQPDNRYEAVEGTLGAEVRDRLTGIVWQRCVLGMIWNGKSCTGTPAGKTWVEAVQAAQAAAPSRVGSASVWQLPNNADLYGLAERACYNPSINTNWFPDTPGDRTWSSTVDTVNTDIAMHVSFSYGHGGSALKKNLGRVRLMRYE